MGFLKYIFILTITYEFLLSQITPYWYFLYDYGDSLSGETAYKIIQDETGNVYAIGVLKESGGINRLSLFSLKKDGSLRWSYIHNNESKGYDILYSQGNIFITGYTSDIYYSETVFLMAFDTLGNLLFSKAYTTDPGRGKSIDIGGGYIFVGAVVDVNNQSNFFPALFVFNWDSLVNVSYYSPGFPYAYYDFSLVSIDYGGDGNIYMGTSSGTVASQNYDFTILSFQPNGNLNFSYHYDSGNHDYVRKIVYGGDDNIYAVGDLGTNDTICVISVTNSGSYRWAFKLGYGWGCRGNDLEFGEDGNVYICGRGKDNIRFFSLYSNGNLRWIDSSYSYVYGSDFYDIEWGKDGNLYVSGIMDFSNPNGILFSYTTSGIKRFERFYDGNIVPLDEGAYYSIVHGEDGYLYIAGWGDIYSEGTNRDFLVFSVDPSLLRIEEKSVFKTTFPVITFKKGTIYISDKFSYKDIYIFSVDGRVVNKINLGFRNRNTIRLSDIKRGVYFIKLQNRNKAYKVKFIKF